MQTIKVTRSLRKWGNAPAVRLPKKIIEAAQMTIDQELQISTRGRTIVLTPIARKRTPTLRELLKNVTPDKIGGEADWGSDVGKERYG